MDEVDIDNVEDLNELEARLYAQIHHESTNEINLENRTELSENAEHVFVATNTNRNLSKRYWCSVGNAAIQQTQEQSSKMIRNPFNAPNTPQKGRYVNNHQQQQRTETESNRNVNISENNGASTSTQNNKLTSEITSTPGNDLLKSGSPPSSNNNNKKTKNVDVDREITKQKLSAGKSNLKLNPVADWMKRKKNNIEKKGNGKSSRDKTVKNSTVNTKQGLFSRQQQKLEKAKRIEEKKKKSKKAKNLAAAIANKINPSEIIDLDSDNESDSSDIIIIPPAPTPTFTVDDSTDEDEKGNLNIVIGHEENALDSTDVQLSSTTSSFIKPQEISKDSDEKRIENSSRCTSPCSIQSSDDFIRNIDRVRLLSAAGGMADDEDLLVLTSDINSLIEAPHTSKQTDDGTCAEKIPNSLNRSLQEQREKSVEAPDTSEFATPKTTEVQPRPTDYRVDQGQFRALDVYESESDITDSVYSKGVNKSTVIREIGSSSDELEDISTCSQRTKRLRKRRASSSNKESDHNNENLSSSSEDENLEDDNKVLRTPLSYIAKGPAVERYQPRNRHSDVSSSISTAPNEHMSDTEFLTTLNNLAQRQDEEPGTQILQETDDSDNENVPTAREMAEKILKQHDANEENESNANDLAIPTNILNGLSKVFEEIDQLDKTGREPISSIDDAVQISDSSDSERENNLFYPSLPGEEAQIIKYSPKNSTVKLHAENGSPIYNVIYIRGIRKPVGVGWNDEMCKFYTDSWNGEHFILGKVLQKMNPEKSLWKIYTEDRFNIKSNKRSNIKCTNCCEFGHMRSKCKRPRKPMICYMCGESGHYEPRCPNTICLRCGNKTQVFTKSCNACFYQNRLTCPICKIPGHSLDYCPDKWRRYHSTTEANIHPNNKVNYNPRRYCCICGARGHISDYCRSALRFSEYPAISSNIKSHEKCYNDVLVRAPYNGIAVNLMYEPCQEYKFDFAEQTSLNKYYGRFLKAVGMDFLFSRKRNSTSVATENAHTKAKKVKRFSSKYEANPYLKAARDKLKENETRDYAPNQVQEISGSGNTDQQSSEEHLKADDVINVEEINEHDVEREVTQNIQLNTINKTVHKNNTQDTNFKSPKNITPASAKCVQFQEDAPLLLDSDSNYSFSEHFDADLNSSREAPPAPKISVIISPPVSEEISNDDRTEREQLVVSSLKRKAREMEALPDFIPLNDSAENAEEDENYIDNSNIGISRQFVAAESDDDESMEHNRRVLSPLPELPCEAKIYLTHFHSKYLLSPPGNAFLVKTSKTHKLKARLDFTSIGHVLVVFGFPTNQDKFQRELLLKYRDLEDENNQRLLHSNINVPKRTYVLIKFLRENIIQLMSNLGNANYLFNRLQYLERQQTKSGLKMAEKIRRSLNMILIGQAGLQDGTIHLDRLLVSLKTLLNDVTEDVAPPELRSEIINHWKVIFSPYRHDNYQKLVDTYNNLVTKSRLPQLNIDPVLLGQKVLDTNFSEEQKQKLEQAITPALNSNDVDSCKKLLSNNLYENNMKRKQTTDTITTSKAFANTATPNINKTKTVALQKANDNSSLNIKSKATSKNTPLSLKSKPFSNSTPGKIRASNSTTQTPNKPTPPSSSTNDDENKQMQKIIAPNTFGKNIQKVESTCDTLLSEIISEKPTSEKNFGGKKRDCMIPSIFWSREAMRYLQDCISFAAAQPKILDKLKRVKNKCRNGHLSYNDYLAVIKLHTALNVK